VGLEGWVLDQLDMQKFSREGAEGGRKDEGCVWYGEGRPLAREELIGIVDV